MGADARENADWDVDRLLLNCVRRVLVLGGDDTMTARLRARGLIVTSNEDPADSSGEPFDAILVGSVARPLRAPAAAAVARRAQLSPFGAVYLSFVRANDAGAALEAAALTCYWAWSVHADEAPRSHDSLDACVAAANPGAVHRASCVVMAVPRGYDPVAHARALYRAKSPGWALEVLENIPDPMRDTPEIRARVAAERQLCFLTWDRTCSLEGQLGRFSRALREFYIVSTIWPRYRQPYLVQAAFWQSIGDAEMGERWLRSVDYALAAEAGAAPQRRAPRKLPTPHEETAPEWHPPARLPRILLVTHAESDYGLDTLYDGLCRILGPENVVEFPWKPTLHGQSREMTCSYPCFFDHPGAPIPLDEVCAQLRAHAFDFVCVTDTLRSLAQNILGPLMEAAGETPLFILDTWDECGDYEEDTLAHLGRTAACAQFKREMLINGQYGPNTFPLPFSYADDLVPQRCTGPRPEAVFWAGKRVCGLRSLYLDRLEAALGLRFTRSYTPPEYSRALLESRIGLCFFGLGFDTVRYWELPAHECLLVAERPPIRIPHNFRDGQTAVFFDDLAELEDKLRYYLANLGKAQEIATAGHAHFMRYHTSTARAQQFLACVQRCMEP